MQILPVALVHFVLVFAGVQPPADSPSVTQAEARCPATALEDRLPTIIAPMAGSEPIWLVDGSFNRWSGPEGLVKSVWVLSRGVEGDLVVSGRRLDGTGVMRFQAGLDAPLSVRAVIPDATRQSVIPGGATPEMMDAHAFRMMYLIYPSPGCWEVTVRLGDHERRIVVEQRRVADAGR